eukprot:m.614861 g.614861  ORF g.614861 m.614861 type:complete len:157 (-) comp58156_c0_seq9:395-865(-)
MPCSHVGHVFRDSHPYKFPGGNPGKTISKNLNRLAEVWLDDYKSIYYKSRADASRVEYGDVSDRKALRERLGCMSFKWYLNHVYPEFFVPTNDVLISAGALNLIDTNTCFDAMSEDDPRPGVYGCHGQGGNQVGFSSNTNFLPFPLGEMPHSTSCI